MADGARRWTLVARPFYCEFLAFLWRYQTGRASRVVGRESLRAARLQGEMKIILE